MNGLYGDQRDRAKSLRDAAIREGRLPAFLAQNPTGYDAAKGVK